MSVEDCYRFPYILKPFGIIPQKGDGRKEFIQFYFLSLMSILFPLPLRILMKISLVILNIFTCGRSKPKSLFYCLSWFQLIFLCLTTADLNFQPPDVQTKSQTPGTLAVWSLRQFIWATRSFS